MPLVYPGPPSYVDGRIMARSERSGLQATIIGVNSQGLNSTGIYGVGKMDERDLKKKHDIIVNILQFVDLKRILL